MLQSSNTNIFELNWEVEVSERFDQTTLLTPLTGPFVCITRKGCTGEDQNYVRVD